MFKYLSIVCMLLGVLLFTTQLLPFSSWAALALSLAGILVGARSLKQDYHPIGKIALAGSIILFIVLLIGLFVRLFIWNRP